MGRGKKKNRLLWDFMKSHVWKFNLSLKKKKKKYYSQDQQAGLSSLYSGEKDPKLL